MLGGWNLGVVGVVVALGGHASHIGYWTAVGVVLTSWAGSLLLGMGDD